MGNRDPSSGGGRMAPARALGGLTPRTPAEVACRPKQIVEPSLLSLGNKRQMRRGPADEAFSAQYLSVWIRTHLS